MRALVTGAAGFLGGHLSRAPAAAGHQVAGADLLLRHQDGRV
ncbi:NAD-dependent epimerase/dehydratase family protein [Nocardia barduliensis]|nr:NAD-dependent epimerase/dehydratase family protein [Nocardia barduliensis]